MDKKYSQKTKMNLKIAGIQDTAIFKGMSINELRKQYPHMTFSKEFFDDMMEEGYFPDETEKMVKDIPMSARLRHILERNDIIFISELKQYSDKELKRFRNMGTETLKELKSICESEGIEIIS